MTSVLTADSDHWADVPRDDHGRWTSGGGGGGAGAKPLTGAEFAKHLDSLGVHADLTGLENVDMADVPAAFDRLWNDFPITHESIDEADPQPVLSRIITADTPDLPTGASMAMGDSWAATGPDPATGDTTIALNTDPALWGGPVAPGDLSLAAGHAAGFSVYSTPGGVLTHEMGHVVQAAWPGGADDFNRMIAHAQFDVFGSGAGRAGLISQAVSTYAMPTTNIGPNFGEFFGEAFAANNIPGYLDSLPKESSALISRFATQMNQAAADRLAADGYPVQRVI